MNGEARMLKQKLEKLIKNKKKIVVAFCSVFLNLFCQHIFFDSTIIKINIALITPNVN